MGIPNPRFIIIERRSIVIKLLAQGLNETEISKQLKINQAIVSRDVKMIKKQSQEALQSITRDLLPFEFGRCHTAVEQLIKEGWKIFQDSSGKWTNHDKISALKLVNMAVRTKMEILLEGPTNLYLQQLQDKLKQLDQEIEDKVNGDTPPVDMLLHDDIKTSGI